MAPVPTLGILMLQGKMAQVAGCMACEQTFPYAVVRKVVEGSTTPRSQADAEAMLPLYVKAAHDLETAGISVITANCGLIALMQDELARAVTVPVVTSAMLLAPALHRMLGPERKIGLLTFFPEALGEKNYRASGWSSADIPVVVGGVSAYPSWLEFLETKEVGPELRRRLRDDLVTVANEIMEREPDVGAFISECTMLPAVLQDVRDVTGRPVYDILTALDWAMSGYLRPAAMSPGPPS